MGYEVRLHIGQEWPFDSTHDGKFSHTIHEIATIDLSNPGYDSRIYKLVKDRQAEKQAALDKISKNPKSVERQNASTMLHTDVSYDDQEVNLYIDNYGMPLVSIPLSEIRAALAADWEDSKKDYSGWDKGYRRFYVALALIDSIIEGFTEWATIREEVLAVNPLAGQLVAIPWGH